jgi:hypothetical protein
VNDESETVMFEEFVTIKGAVKELVAKVTPLTLVSVEVRLTAQLLIETAPTLVSAKPGTTCPWQSI